MTTPLKALLHTDIIAAHLRGSESPSLMRRASGMFLCYTTVFNAIELFGMFPGARGRSAVEDALGATKMLGLNAREAPKFASLIAGRQAAERWRALIAGLCIESRLPLITASPGRFRHIGGLTIVSADLLRRHHAGGDVLRAAGVRT